MSFIFWLTLYSCFMLFLLIWTVLIQYILSFLNQFVNSLDVSFNLVLFWFKLKYLCFIFCVFLKNFFFVKVNNFTVRIEYRRNIWFYMSGAKQFNYLYFSEIHSKPKNSHTNQTDTVTKQPQQHNFQKSAKIQACIFLDLLRL